MSKKIEYNVNNFPRVFVTADIVVIKKNPTTKLDYVLLIKRLKDPFKNQWALPGGFFDIDLDETIEDSAVRELLEETNLKINKNQIELIGVFSKRGRDPREEYATEPCRILSVSFKTTLIEDSPELKYLKANDDAKSVKWHPINKLPDLAFDHLTIINTCLSF